MPVRNHDKLFKPGVVALIGATLGHGSVGAVLSRNLRRGAFEGPLMQVSPDDSVPLPETRFVADAEGAAAAIGHPVALKIRSPN